MSHSSDIPRTRVTGTDTFSRRLKAAQVTRKNWPQTLFVTLRMCGMSAAGPALTPPCCRRYFGASQPNAAIYGHWASCA